MTGNYKIRKSTMVSGAALAPTVTELLWPLLLKALEVVAAGAAGYVSGTIIGDVLHVEKNPEEVQRLEEKLGEEEREEEEREEDKEAEGENSSEIITRGKSRAPETGDPGSVYEQVDGNGNVMSRTKYGANGRPEYRDDLTGRPHYDKNTGRYLEQHRHNFTYNENGQSTGETVTPISD